MTDRYQKIRDALAMGPTPESWVQNIDEDECGPDTIRTLLAERDTLLNALHKITAWPDGGNRYGQENIKRFALEVINTILTKENSND